MAAADTWTWTWTWTWTYGERESSRQYPVSRRQYPLQEMSVARQRQRRCGFSDESAADDAAGGLRRGKDRAVAAGRAERAVQVDVRVAGAAGAGKQEQSNGAEDVKTNTSERLWRAGEKQTSLLIRYRGTTQ